MELVRTLRLADPATSPLAFQAVAYPDGQQDILLAPLDGPRPVRIETRLSSFRDVELLLCATQALRRAGVKEIHLYAPYLLGARSDRQFQPGGPSYLVDVVAPVLNSQHYETVTVLDPHSDVAAACIQRLHAEPNTALVQWAIGQAGLTDYVLVSPDAGSLKKAYLLAAALGYTGELVVCAKHRDLATGKILSTEVPLLPHQRAAPLLLVDDICDGGRTFVEIAKAARAQGHDGPLYLIVSHGTFSAGFAELRAHFTGVFTTDSFRAIDATWFDGYHHQPTGIHQLPLFS